MWHHLTRKLGEWRGVFLIAPSVAGVLIAGSMSGVFQLFEWATIDPFFQLRPSEPVDNRIVIVTVDESDINALGQWPMSDSTLAQLLNNIKAQQPRGIALDLYRDLADAKGHEELVDVFESTPNLIGIEKVTGETVAPPPALDSLGQTAAADLVIDADGKVRRALITLGTQDGEFREGLGAKLALMYLKEEGIHLREIDAEKKIYGLGRGVFVPLTGYEGGYIGSDTGGYQTLLNFRGQLDSFHHISLKAVLANEISEDLMRDRLVFIGATTDSLKDIFQTPYNHVLLNNPPVPGVVIHANVTSQMLSAALEGRPLLQVWNRPLNRLWILVWSFVGATGSWWILQTKLGCRNTFLAATIGTIILETSVLVATSYVAFLNGWIIIIFTPFLALTSSAILVANYHNQWELKKANEQLEEYSQNLEIKVSERTRELAAANQKITKLNEQLQEENLRLSAELEVTRRIQQMILPKQTDLESIEGLEIASFMEPAEEVGGDYYDVLPSAGGVKIGIGDVTGHGLESGVLMIMAQTAVRTLQEMKETNPVKFLDVLNRTIYRNVQRLNPYKNMSLALLDYQSGILSLSGQHEKMIVARRGGKIELIDTVDLGFPIGLDSEISEFIDQLKIELQAGDVVVLYTDGITEAEDALRKAYGLQRLCDVVQNHWRESAIAIKDAVIADLRQHIGKTKVGDDITLLVLKQK